MVYPERNGKVSVCLASKNGEQFIRRQIDTILSQLSDNDECIVSDDASDDNTLRILNSYQDHRLRIYKNNFNNVVRNFEFVLKNATGDYIFLADQDDVWLGGKVDNMLKYLDTYDMVVSNAIVVDRDEKQLFNFFSKSATEMNADNLLVKILRTPTSGCCMAFRKSLLTKALPFPENMYMHDRWLWAIVCLDGKPLILDEPLILYRRHGKNFTNTEDHDPVLLKRYHGNIWLSLRYKYILLSSLFIFTLRKAFK